MIQKVNTDYDFTSYRHIWKVSWPIITGLVAQNLMVVIDTAFLGRLGEVSLGAAAIGGMFYLCLVMLGSGFSVGTQIVIGRRNGEKRLLEAGRVFDHAILVLVVLALVLFLVVSYVAPWFLQTWIKSERILDESLIFLSYRRFGFLFGFLVLGFNAFYTGITRTLMLTMSTIIMAVLNVFFDYVLIFGHLGMPAMGIAGAALATNLAEGITFAFYLVFSIRKGFIGRFKLFSLRKLHIDVFRPLLRVAGPVMLQYFFSFSAWFIFFLIIEQIGEIALAASNITRSFYMLLMIPVWGLSSATSTLVSNVIGQGKNEEVMPLIGRILIIGVLSTLLLMQLNIFFPRQIAHFFTDDQRLIDASVPLMYVTAGALMVFSVSMIIFSGLSGTGKTHTALYIEMVCIAIYLITAFILAVGMKADAAVVWMVEIVYFSVMGMLAWLYLRSGRWRHTKI